MYRIISSTDKGLLRDINEDRYCGVSYGSCAYGLVCDGLGGENAGALASSLACEEIRRMAEDALRPSMDVKSIYNLLDSAIETANTVIYDRASTNPDNLHGMGTTVCLAVVSSDKIYIANIGDSRAYLIHNGIANKLTVDHTIVQHKVNTGELTPDQAKSSSDKHLLIKAVGIEDRAAPDYFDASFDKGDILLLCSDGIHGVLSEGELADLAHTAAKCGCADGFIKAANDRGGYDNETVVLIYSEEV